MENKIASLETLRFKGKSLRVSYFKEGDVMKAGKILRKRSETMDKVHALQNEVNKLLFDNLTA